MQSNAFFSGNCAGGVSFDRPYPGKPPTALFLTAAYRAHAFSLEPDVTGGPYSLSAVLYGSGFYPVTFIYNSTFDPANPLQNILVGNDYCDGSYYKNCIVIGNLPAGVYVLVVAGMCWSRHALLSLHVIYLGS